MSRNRNSELYKAWAGEHIMRADYFVSRLFLGRGQFDTRRAATIGEARRHRADQLQEWEGRNGGRRPVIYAITKGVPLTIFVE